MYDKSAYSILNIKMLSFEMFNRFFRDLVETFPRLVQR